MENLMKLIEVMLKRAKEIREAESKKNPNISGEEHAKGMVDALELVLKTVKSEMEGI